MIARDALDYGENVLGRSPVNGGLFLLNLAGRELTNMSNWNWLQRIATIGVTSGQNFVSLPTDFGSMVALVGNDSFLRTFIPSSTENVLRHRQFQDSIQDGSFHYKVSYQPAASGSGPPLPVLELGQDVETTEANYGQIAYKSKWNELTAEGEVISIPLELDLLYLAIVECMWFGTEEQNTPSGAHFWLRINELKQTSVFRNAVQWDERIQRTTGRMTGGAARRQSIPGAAFLSDFDIADPT